jgi:hypothetical protein
MYEKYLTEIVTKIPVGVTVLKTIQVFNGEEDYIDPKLSLLLKTIIQNSLSN